MKKRVEELTLGDIHKICIPFEPCAQCPLFDYYGGCAKNNVRAYENIKNKEVEIIEKDW